MMKAAGSLILQYLSLVRALSRWHRDPGDNDQHAEGDVGGGKHPGGGVVKEDAIDPAFDKASGDLLAAESVLPKR